MGFPCGICGDSFSSKLQLGRHRARVHRGMPQVAVECYDGLSVSHGVASPGNAECNVDLFPSTDDNDLVLEDMQTGGCNPVSSMSNATPFLLADDVCAFFTSYGDRSQPLYDKVAPLQPPLHALSEASKDLLRYCTSQKYSQAEIASHYELISKVESRGGRSDLGSQFPSSSSFVKYVERARKWAVFKAGWRCTLIETDFGHNRSGVFRLIVPLVIKEVVAAGGISAIIPFEESFIDNARVYTSPCGSRVMQAFSQHNALGIPLVGFDVHADGTTLSKSGSQSANAMRIRFFNIKGRSERWHDVAIAPTVDSGSQRRSKEELRKARLHLFQRFSFKVYEDLIRASQDGFQLPDGTVIGVRVAMLVCDQKQERGFLCLKAAGSYADCSQCLMPFIEKEEFRPIEASEDDIIAPINAAADAEGGNEEDDDDSSKLDDMDCFKPIFSIHTNGSKASPRSVLQTVQDQLTVARLSQKRARKKRGDETVTVMRSEIQQATAAKSRLQQESASEYPPALAAFHGLGTPPFHLYRCVGFDRLHILDLGLARLIPDMAFKIFKEKDYNRSQISKSALVGIANQRIADLPRSARISRKAPFKLDSGELQAGMSGKVRREQAAFLWYSLMGLKPDTNPDDDKLLEAALFVDLLERECRGVNYPESKMCRTAEEIERCDQLFFKAGLAIASGLDVNINTKLHRVLHHMGDYLTDFGCIRRGETDANETLHLGIKQSYLATNHELLTLNKQLIKIRTAAEASLDPYLSERIPDAPHLGARLLLESEPIGPFEFKKHREVRGEDAGDENIEGEMAEYPDFAEEPLDLAAFSRLETQLSECKSIADVQMVLDSKHVSTYVRLWQQKDFVVTSAVFPWRPTSYQKLRVYATDRYRGMSRYDAIEYKSQDDSSIRQGILQCLFEQNSHKSSRIDRSKQRFCIVRRLVQTEGENGNQRVVQEFGHKRFSYLVREDQTDVVLECLPTANILRPLMLVRDPYEVLKRYGVAQRLKLLPDTLCGAKMCEVFSSHWLQIYNVFA